MKYRMTPSLIDTHLKALKAGNRVTSRCGRCNRILKFRWRGSLCAACAIGQGYPEATHDR